MRTEQCDASETLKNSGLAKTAQRMAVLESLLGTDHPLNANEILQQTTGEIRINRVTVYRILSSLRDSGIIREIENGHGISSYEMACAHNPVHPHFRCRSCGRIICLPSLTLSQAWDWLAQPADFSIEKIDVQLTGICAPCQQAENSNTLASIPADHTERQM
ncbi:MAG: transcriptional repressor [Syntrophales bacterium]|jgi:Fur family ferric uptake transcriptional regulator|nr:transcriptional repressor [Syntrophales bacterium]